MELLSSCWSYWLLLSLKSGHREIADEPRTSITCPIKVAGMKVIARSRSNRTACSNRDPAWGIQPVTSLFVRMRGANSQPGKRTANAGLCAHLIALASQIGSVLLTRLGEAEIHRRETLTVLWLLFFLPMLVVGCPLTSQIVRRLTCRQST